MLCLLAIRYCPSDVIKGNGSTFMNALSIILAIFLPPLAAFLIYGDFPRFWLNVMLSVCGVLPVTIYAPWLVVKRDRPGLSEV
jgi:uncharacterized membrane protein YqaE (UPF0057 family)